MTTSPTAFPVPGENFVDREGELRGVTSVDRADDNTITVRYLRGDPEVYPPTAPTTQWWQRLTAEYTDLTSKFSKLQTFLGTSEFMSMSAADITDLHEQLLHMGRYRDVLLRRMARIPPGAN